MAGYVIWSGISISGKQNGTWGWACNYCVLKNPSMWRPCSAFKTSYLFLSLVLSILHTGHRFSHRKNAREGIWTEYGISMADSQAHSQSQGKNVELHAEKAVAQGRSFRSTCTTQNYRYSLPSYCTTGYTELRTYDSRDRQNNSRTSFLRRYIPRKKKKKHKLPERTSISSLMESPSRVPLPPCHILSRIIEEAPFSHGRCKGKRTVSILMGVVYTLYGCIIIFKLGIIKGKKGGGGGVWSSEPAQRKSLV